MAGIIDQINVRDRVVFITGAGQGIGRTYAREFARAGAIPVIAEINRENGERVAAEIRAEQGRCLAVATDVASSESVDAAVAATLAEFGRIDVLINNAAVFAPLVRGNFDDIDPQVWDRVMRVNVTGAWLCARAVVPTMRKAGWGRIINVSSATVPLGMPMYAHYVTSKSALIGLTRSLARELGPQGITVNCVMPGLTETDVEIPGRTDATRHRVIDMQCIKRVGTSEDIVGMMLFLSSPASGFMAGQTVLIDGGSAHL
ncbi:MAG: family oxidoreductase [Noviherbaspirillum sp.]|nr:family oxidoreductase [Noviherbaspirillum sp.]